MYLPLAIIYNEIGILDRIRYLCIAGYPNINYNKGDIPTLKEDIRKSVRVIELPTEQAYDLYTPRVAYTEDVRVELQFFSYVTVIDANGIVIEDRTQILISDNVVYAVDYKGNIFKMSKAELAALVEAEKLNLGNATLTPSKELLPLYKCAIPSLVYSDFNLYESALEAAGTMQGIDKPLTEKYVLDRFENLQSSVLCLPKGLGDTLIEGPIQEYADSPFSVEYNPEGTAQLKAVICPDKTKSLICYMETNDLDTFKAPREVFGEFCFVCNTVKNYTLPERVFAPKAFDYALSNSVHCAAYTLKVDRYDKEALILYHKVHNYELAIDIAPNLISCDIQTNINLLSTSTISIRNASKLKCITFGHKVNKNSPGGTPLSIAETAKSLDLCIDVLQPEVVIDLTSRIDNLDVSLFSLDDKKTVIIRHTGIRDCILRLEDRALDKRVVFQHIQDSSYQQFRRYNAKEGIAEDDILREWNKPDSLHVRVW